ncbi:MAG: hypothetical protein ACPGJV_08545 [Bacteriovoracaceae bacterium]
MGLKCLKIQSVMLPFAIVLLLYAGIYPQNLQASGEGTRLYTYSQGKLSWSLDHQEIDDLLVLTLRPAPVKRWKFNISSPKEIRISQAKLLDVFQTYGIPAHERDKFFSLLNGFKYRESEGALCRVIHLYTGPLSESQGTELESDSLNAIDGLELEDQKERKLSSNEGLDVVRSHELFDFNLNGEGFTVRAPENKDGEILGLSFTRQNGRPLSDIIVSKEEDGSYGLYENLILDASLMLDDEEEDLRGERLLKFSFKERGNGDLQIGFYIGDGAVKHYRQVSASLEKNQEGYRTNIDVPRNFNKVDPPQMRARELRYFNSFLPELGIELSDIQTIPFCEKVPDCYLTETLNILSLKKPETSSSLFQCLIEKDVIREDQFNEKVLNPVSFETREEVKESLLNCYHKSSFEYLKSNLDDQFVLSEIDRLLQSCAQEQNSLSYKLCAESVEVFQRSLNELPDLGQKIQLSEKVESCFYKKLNEIVDKTEDANVSSVLEETKEEEDVLDFSLMDFDSPIEEETEEVPLVEEEQKESKDPGEELFKSLHQFRQCLKSRKFNFVNKRDYPYSIQEIWDDFIFKDYELLTSKGKCSEKDCLMEAVVKSYKKKILPELLEIYPITEESKKERLEEFSSDIENFKDLEDLGGELENAEAQMHVKLSRESFYSMFQNDEEARALNEDLIQREVLNPFVPEDLTDPESETSVSEALDFYFQEAMTNSTAPSTQSIKLAGEKLIVETYKNVSAAKAKYYFSENDKDKLNFVSQRIDECITLNQRYKTQSLSSLIEICEMQRIEEVNFRFAQKTFENTIPQYFGLDRIEGLELLRLADDTKLCLKRFSNVLGMTSKLYKDYAEGCIFFSIVELGLQANKLKLLTFDDIDEKDQQVLDEVLISCTQEKVMKRLKGEVSEASLDLFNRAIDFVWKDDTKVYSVFDYFKAYPAHAKGDVDSYSVAIDEALEGFSLTNKDALFSEITSECFKKYQEQLSKIVQKQVVEKMQLENSFHMERMSEEEKDFFFNAFEPELIQALMEKQIVSDRYLDRAELGRSVSSEYLYDGDALEVLLSLAKNLSKEMQTSYFLDKDQLRVGLKKLNDRLLRELEAEGELDQDLFFQIINEESIFDYLTIAYIRDYLDQKAKESLMIRRDNLKLVMGKDERPVYDKLRWPLFIGEESVDLYRAFEKSLNDPIALRNTGLYAYTQSEEQANLSGVRAQVNRTPGQDLYSFVRNRILLPTMLGELENTVEDLEQLDVYVKNYLLSGDTGEILLSDFVLEYDNFEFLSEAQAIYGGSYINTRAHYLEEQAAHKKLKANFNQAKKEAYSREYTDLVIKATLLHGLRLPAGSGVRGVRRSDIKRINDLRRLIRK